jgi:hypothetical protein
MAETLRPGQIGPSSARFWWTSWYSESPPLSRSQFSKLIEYDKPIYEPFISSRFQLSIINHWWCIKEVTDMNGLVKITWRIPLLMGKQRRNTLWYENQWWIPTILGGSSHLVTIYNWGYNPLTKWDEPPSTETLPTKLEHAPEALPNLYLSYDTSGNTGEKWCSRIAKKLIAHGVNLSVLEGHLVAESWAMAETFISRIHVAIGQNPGT